MYDRERCRINDLIILKRWLSNYDPDISQSRVVRWYCNLGVFYSGPLLQGI